MMKIEQQSHNSDKHGEDSSKRFWDELAKLDQFGRGVVSGGTARAADFGNMIAHPLDAVQNATRNIGDALQVANNYYGQARPEQIANDARLAFIEFGNVLEDYGHKTPAERGAICGGAAFDLLLAEVAALGLAKSTFAAGDAIGAVSLQSRSGEEFERLISTLRIGAEAEFGLLVEGMIAALPRSLRDFITSNGIEVVAVPTMAAVAPECSSVQGMFLLRDGKPYIFVAEDLHRTGAGRLDTRLMALTLRHELAHAIDGLTMKNRWLSDLPQVKAIFDRDFSALTQGEQKFLLETIGNGSRKTVRREVVAELISRKAAPTGSKVDKFFFSKFPQFDRALHSSNSPFVAR